MGPYKWFSAERGLGDDYPAYSLTWYDAIEFCNRLSVRDGLIPANIPTQSPGKFDIRDMNWDKSANGYRLPTEAEWEYAAGGGLYSMGYLYAGSDNIDEVAWYEDHSSGLSHPVGMKRLNELGLYDMSGNVWEWCWDRSGSFPSSDQTNPEGASTGSNRVIRGGSWYDSAKYCTVSNRNGDSPANSHYYKGSVC